MDQSDLSNAPASLPVAPPGPPYQSPPYPPPRRGSKYRTYPEADMLAAKRAVTEEGMSMRQAALRFGVPKASLGRRLHDKPRPAPRKSSKQDNGNKIKKPRQRLTRYHWTEAEMEAAVAAVTDDGGKVSDEKVSAAARRFGVPPSQLNARARGRPLKNLRGLMTRLTLRQEALLAEWAGVQCTLGCPPTKDEVFRLADRVIRKNGGGEGDGSGKRLGRQWIIHWMKRYPNIEVLEWETKDENEEKEAKEKTPKPKQRQGRKKTAGLDTVPAPSPFSGSMFEPVIDLDGPYDDASGST